MTFGAEPKDYEVQEYIQKYYSSLKFSPAVDTVVKDVKRSPKRLQREADELRMFELQQQKKREKYKGHSCQEYSH